MRIGHRIDHRRAAAAGAGGGVLGAGVMLNTNITPT
jgi:hypothetical protein